MLHAYFIGFWVLLPISVAAALKWGARPERQVAWMMTAGAIFSMIAMPSGTTRYQHIEWIVLAIDAAMFLGFTRVAIRSQRAWVIWAAGFQGVAVIGHIGKLMVPETTRMAYAIMEQASSYPTVIALLIGTWQYQRRAKAISSRF
jgi:hypothetical protein